MNVVGNPFLLQACLRLPDKQLPKPLEAGKKYHFKKEGHRLYQLMVPMDLVRDDWKAIGRCIITEYTIGNNRTEGTFVVAQVFTPEESKAASSRYISLEEAARIAEKAK